MPFKGIALILVAVSSAAAESFVEWNPAVDIVENAPWRLPVEPVSDLPDLGNYVGRSVILGIRPEDIEDSIFASDQRVGARLKARIELVESLGSEIIAHFDVGQSRLANVDPDTETELTSGVPAVGRFDPRSTVRIGDEIEVVVNIDKLHFFDPETQLAL